MLLPNATNVEKVKYFGGNVTTGERLIKSDKKKLFDYTSHPCQMKKKWVIFLYDQKLNSGVLSIFSVQRFGTWSLSRSSLTLILSSLTSRRWLISKLRKFYINSKCVMTPTCISFILEEILPTAVTPRDWLHQRWKK